MMVAPKEDTQPIRKEVSKGEGLSEIKILQLKMRKVAKWMRKEGDSKKRKLHK